MFARYAKEDFDTDDLERKRAVVKRLGADLKLSNRAIQFTPVKYLVPIAEKYPELKEQFELARTDSQQMKKDLKEGLISQWYTRQDDGSASLRLNLALKRSVRTLGSTPIEINQLKKSLKGYF